MTTHGKNITIHQQLDGEETQEIYCDHCGENIETLKERHLVGKEDICDTCYEIAEEFSLAHGFNSKIPGDYTKLQAFMKDTGIIWTWKEFISLLAKHELVLGVISE